MNKEEIQQKYRKEDQNRNFFLFLRWMDLVPGFVDRPSLTKDYKLSL